MSGSADQARAATAPAGEISSEPRADWIDEQIVATERALADAIAQRDRESTADGIEAMAAAGIVGDRIRETAPAQSVSIRAGDLIVMSSDVPVGVG